LLRQAGRVLLARQVPDHVRQGIRAVIEPLPETKVTDLRDWSLRWASRYEEFSLQRCRRKE
jgi:hypothetical protein